MLFYGLYLFGSILARLLPRRLCYWIARRGGDFSYWRSAADQESVRNNLAAILRTDEVPPHQVREVFRSFAMYLVDFFRFGRLTPAEIRRRVRIEGMDQMQAALAQGHGAIGLTAHLGNFELAGAVLALLGFKVNAVVLSHGNPQIDSFFTRQRSAVGVKPLAVQRETHRDFFKACLSCLERNEVLALVGDRDFFDHGIELSWFGKTLRVPTGPAAFSLKTGAPIVPGFLVREKAGDYRFILEPPIAVPQGVSRDEAVRRITQSCLDVMGKYIRQYPTQWYIFRDFWERVSPVII